MCREVYDACYADLGAQKQRAYEHCDQQDDLCTYQCDCKPFEIFCSCAAACSEQHAACVEAVDDL